MGYSDPDRMTVCAGRQHIRFNIQLRFSTCCIVFAVLFNAVFSDCGGL